MKSRLALVLSASLLLCGCSVFRQSPTWDSVVASRSQYHSSASLDAKDGYLNHLHQVLLNAGVEHKVVTYQFRYFNPYREESAETATAILYRDSTTPNHPWWIMDEYHHVPVWLPNWEIDAQLEFFIQRKAEVVSVKDYAGRAVEEPTVATVTRKSRGTIVHTPREKKFRALFAAGTDRSKPRKSPAKPAPVVGHPSTPKTFSVRKGDATVDSRAVSLFRTAHGTQFDPGSSIDRAKMNELRRQLLNRGQRISLRNQ